MKLSLIALSVACLSLNSYAHENGTIKIYDAGKLGQFQSISNKGTLVLNDGILVTSKAPQTAEILNLNLEKVRDYFAQEFGRRSWDNKGSDIEASVNVNAKTVIDIFGRKQNAGWMQSYFTFGAGNKRGFDNFEKALDVVGHEYTHAVIQSSSALKYEGQSGALNEHFADVFGVIINNLHNRPANPYLIGATVLNGRASRKAEAMRDMMNPKKGLSEQPEHMKDLKTKKYKIYGNGCVPSQNNDRCGVHVLSGIPNKMAAIVMNAIGIEESGPLFYNVMTKRLTVNSNFTDYREALMIECQQLSTMACQVVDGALKEVGI